MRAEGGLGSEVAVPFLTWLASHEGQERLVTLAGVEGDTLGHYTHILRTGRTKIRGGDRYRDQE